MISQKFCLNLSNLFFRLSSHLELKRPDSVITTSSIVSSSDTNSQAGDSSSIEVGVPPSVYAISGLYGPISAGNHHHRQHSDINPRSNHSGTHIILHTIHLKVLDLVYLINLMVKNIIECRRFLCRF